jgi:hypothetical protein
MKTLYIYDRNSLNSFTFFAPTFTEHVAVAIQLYACIRQVTTSNPCLVRVIPHQLLLTIGEIIHRLDHNNLLPSPFELSSQQ